MSDQSIQSRDISVAGVFQDFYVVPDYQREFVWESEQVEQLLGDIRGEQITSEQGDAPEYFIGSIVVCPGKGGTLDLIDGQQRMTTLYLTLCAIRDRLLAIGERVPARPQPTNFLHLHRCIWGRSVSLPLGPAVWGQRRRTRANR